MDESLLPAPVRRVTAQTRDLALRGLALIDVWPVVEIAQLYEDVDNLAATVGVPGIEAITAAALELAVYLASLVEAGKQANAAERERARGLLGQLAAICGADAAASTGGAHALRSSQHRVVYYLRADDRELPGLVQQLTHERFVTRSFSDLNRAVVEVAALPPHALVVDEGFVTGLTRMIEAVERSSGEEHRRPLVLALCDGGDVRQRLFAQRSGADAVLEGADALHATEQMMGLFLRRSREDARVLIIDDDASMAMFCATVLGYKGITTRIEHNARDGLAALGEFHPDLVLLDLYLPDMNGIEVAQLIRERPEMALTPIVFMSGEEDIEKRFDAIRMGGDDFLAKPTKPRHLLASVTGRLARVRKLSVSARPVDAAGGLRHGRIDRATLVHEIERARRGELGECVVLLMLSVDDVPALAKRLGFVRTGDLAMQVGTAIASEPALKTGVCALGDFSFISLLTVSGEGAAAIATENLRARLSGRGWMDASTAVRVSFSMGWARADEPGVTIDDLLGSVSDAVHAAQGQGGGRSERVLRNRDENEIAPEVRLAHAILRRPLIAETTQFRFRSLVPLRGQLTSQYLADFALVAPKASHAMRIERAVFQPIARSLNVMRAVDRWQVHALGRRTCEESGLQPDLRVLLPLSIDSLRDPGFAQWLQADLHGLHCDADMLALVFDATAMIDNVAQANRALEAIQTAGVRLCLSGFTDFGPDQQRLCRLPSIYANLIPWSAAGKDWSAQRARLIAESIKHGKIVVVDGVHDPAPLGDLFRDGAHYVIGDALAQWSDRLRPAGAVAKS